MPGNATTLYISDSVIRLMAIRGKRIHTIAEMPLEINLADIAAGEKEAEIAAGIRSLFRDNKVRIDNGIVVGLSGLHCISRPLSLPELPKAMLAEAVTREAGRVLPVPLEQMYISWQILTVSAGKINVFMVAMPKQIADTIMRVLGMVGFKPTLVDIKPMALARLAQEATALIVDVQEKEFDIINLVDGVPQPVRTLSFPEGITSLEEKVLVVRDEVQRTVQFYNEHNPDNPIPPESLMLVSGELSGEEELAASLAEETGFRAAPLESPVKCPDDIDPSLYLTNVGLALKGSPREAGPLVPNFNMLPIPYQPKQISLGKLLYVPITAAAIGLIFLLVMNIQDTAANIDSLQGQLDSTSLLLEKRQTEKKELMDNITAVEEKLAGMQTNSDDFVVALDNIDLHGEILNGDIEAAVDNVIDGLALTRIGRVAGQLTITGIVATEQEILEYVRKLDATGRFAEITINNLNKLCASDNTSDTMNFSLAVRLEDPE